MTYCTRWSKNVSLACLQRLEVLQGIRSLLAPEPCNRTMVVSWWKTCWLGFKLGIPITQKGVSSKDNCGVCRWRIQPQEDVVYLRQWIDIEMTKWQEMERSRILLVKQPKQRLGIITSQCPDIPDVQPARPGMQYLSKEAKHEIIQKAKCWPLFLTKCLKYHQF